MQFIICERFPKTSWKRHIRKMHWNLHLNQYFYCLFEVPPIQFIVQEGESLSSPLVPIVRLGDHQEAISCLHLCASQLLHCTLSALGHFPCHQCQQVWLHVSQLGCAFYRSHSHTCMHVGYELLQVCMGIIIGISVSLIVALAPRILPSGFWFGFEDTYQVLVLLDTFISNLFSKNSCLNLAKNCIPTCPLKCSHIDKHQPNKAVIINNLPGRFP